MGAGKTSIGRRLADRLALAFVDSDREVEAQAGAPVATIFACEGEAGFRGRERTVIAAALSGDGCVLATGGGAVLDAGTRALLRREAFVVHLHVDVDGQLLRLARDRVRPLLQQGDGIGDRRAALERLADERGPLYADVADLRFDTAGLAPADAAERLALALRDRWPEGAAA